LSDFLATGAKFDVVAKLLNVLVLVVIGGGGY